MGNESLIKQLKLLETESEGLVGKGDPSALIGISKLMLDITVALDNRNVFRWNTFVQFKGISLETFNN